MKFCSDLLIFILTYKSVIVDFENTKHLLTNVEFFLCRCQDQLFGTEHLLVEGSLLEDHCVQYLDDAESLDELVHFEIGKHC